jgi:subtilisin family serine protease
MRHHEDFWLCIIDCSVCKNLRMTPLLKDFPACANRRMVPEENFAYPTGGAGARHGTMTFSLAGGAVHNNEKGFAAGINIARENMFAYNHTLKTDGVIEGLEWLVFRGVKVISISLGIPNKQTRADFIRKMQELRNDGYDFLVTQSGGNGFLNTNNARSGVIASEASDEQRRRFITVGNIVPPDSYMDDGGDYVRMQIDYPNTSRGTNGSGSNYGELIDVVAPGHQTYSADNSDPWYQLGTGTSSSAPFVSALAGMVWDERPGLSGQQVKSIVTDSSKANPPIIDNRKDLLYYDPDYFGNEYYAIDAHEAMIKTTLI